MGISSSAEKYWQYNQYSYRAAAANGASFNPAEPTFSRGSLALELLEQLLRLWRTLSRCQFQPMAGLLRFIVARLAIQLAEFQLGAHIAGAGGLAQQLKTHAPITRVAAITAQHLPQPTLRLHHTLQSRLLKQMTSKAFDARGVTEARIVQ